MKRIKFIFIIIWIQFLKSVYNTSVNEISVVTALLCVSLLKFIIVVIAQRTMTGSRNQLEKLSRDNNIIIMYGNNDCGDVTSHFR